MNKRYISHKLSMIFTRCENIRIEEILRAERERTGDESLDDLIEVFLLARASQRACLKID